MQFISLARTHARTHTRTHERTHARTHVRRRPLTCLHARALHAPARRSPRSEIKKVDYDAWFINIMELKQVLNPKP